MSRPDLGPLRSRAITGSQNPSVPISDPVATVDINVRRGASAVLALVAQGRSYRLIGRELGLSKNTVADIVRRNRTRHPAR